MESRNNELLYGSNKEKESSITLFYDNDIIKNYANPPIPDEYRYLMGYWNNGFVIERKSDGSLFTWVPVEWLQPNGTLDGKIFDSRLGRRNFSGDKTFYGKCYKEPLDEEFLYMYGSISKYGGIYISSHNISINHKTGRPQSIEEQNPLTEVNYFVAKKIAISMIGRGEVTGHIPFGCEFDSILEWFIETGARTIDEITVDSSNWGNYSSEKNRLNQITKTGSNPQWCTNNIWDLAGNVQEFTQESYYESSLIQPQVVRGGCYRYDGKFEPAGKRIHTYSLSGAYNLGFRVALTIR